MAGRSRKALRERIFDPFVTTRMGRGGSGLGLHISHNAVVNVLGGTIRRRVRRTWHHLRDQPAPVAPPELQAAA